MSKREEEPDSSKHDSGLRYEVKGLKGDRINEAFVVGKQWDRILILSTNDIRNYDSRNKLKSALKGLEAYFADYIEKDKKYKTEKKELQKKEKENIMDEIDAVYEWMGMLKRLQNRTVLKPLKRVRMWAQ